MFHGHMKTLAYRSLSGRGAIRIAALLAIVLTLPSMRAGWIVDDHFHRAIMVAPPELRTDLPGPLDMFHFLDGDPDHTRSLIDAGFVPWWTDLEIKGAFWRPVTAITHWLDYQLWPESPALMHLHGVLWYGATVLVLGLFYRRMMGATWVAGLAVVLYAVDDARGLPVGFIANRNTLIATFFGIVTLLAHDRWRRGAHREKLIAGAGFAAFVLSLLASEAGLATTAYLFAYALFVDRASRRARIMSLVPYAVIVVVWRIVWTALGYGVSAGMGLYIDPLAEPIAYAMAALARIPVLLTGQFALPPADVSILLGPHYAWIHWLVSVVLIAGIVAIAAPVLRRSADARFWTTGMLLSLLPICATFPSDRLLGFVGIGAMALIARFLGCVWARPSLAAAQSDETESAFGDAVSTVVYDGDSHPRRPLVKRRRLTTVLAAFLVFVHVIVAPVGLMARSAYPTGPQWMMDQLLVRTPFDASIRDKTLVIVNAPMVFYTMHLYVRRALDGLPVPRRVRNLASGMPSMQIKRTDAVTLSVRPKDGFLYQIFDRLFRSPRHPLALGDRIELTGLTIVVSDMTGDGRPAEVQFRFDTPLEDESLAFLYWVDGAYAWWTPPPIGTTVEVPCRFPKFD